jgi:hypothetical protein
LSLLTSCNDSAKREISFHWALPRARRPRGLRRRVGGDTGEWAPSGRCSPSLFGSSPRSAWKRNSAKFTVASNRSDAALSTRQQHGGTPSASKRSDLVAGVAPLCIKELRLVTMQLPENSANFAFKEFYEVRAPACNAALSRSSTKPYILWCWTKPQDLGSSRLHPCVAMMVPGT